MAEAPTFYELLSPLTRLSRDASNQPITVDYPLGTVLEVTAAEWRAFGDRFKRVDPRDVPAHAIRLPAPTPAAPAPAGTQLNPELYELVQRAQAGEASADEQAIVGDIVAFMAHYARGVATPEETATLETVLTDFGMPLFV